MKINANIQALFTQTILAHNEEKMGKSTQKMSSGYKINRAMDNPAGMAISNRMKARLQSLDRANKNAKNAINTVQTADGGLAEIEEMLQRMNELSVQAANGLISGTDRLAIQEEINQLTDEISRISKNTTYNTQSLLDGSQALKGYVKNEVATPAYEASKVFSVRDYNEDFENGKYKATVELKYTTKDADGHDLDKPQVTASVSKLEDEAGEAVTIKSVEPVIFYDDYENPKNVTGVSLKVTLVGGGQVTLDANIRMLDELDTTKKRGEIDETNNPVEFDINFETARLGGMKIQTGAEEGQEVQIVIPEVSLKTLNFVDLDGKRTLDMSTEESATRAIKQIESAIDHVSAVRAKVGAYQNRIEKTISNLDATIENLTESYSTIKDLDMAEGMVEYTTLQVLIQAGNSMLAQANEQPQQALQLLQ